MSYFWGQTEVDWGPASHCYVMASDLKGSWIPCLNQDLASPVSQFLWTQHSTVCSPPPPPPHPQSIHKSKNSLNGLCLIAHKSESQDFLHMENVPTGIQPSVGKNKLPLSMLYTVVIVLCYFISSFQTFTIRSGNLYGVHRWNKSMFCNVAGGSRASSALSCFVFSQSCETMRGGEKSL